MTTKQTLDCVLQDLPENCLGEVLDFAQFLQTRDDREPWLQFGRSQISRAYGDDEPEYTEADIKPEVDR